MESGKNVYVTIFHKKYGEVKTVKKKILWTILVLVILALAATAFILTRKPDYSNLTLKVYSSIDLAGGSYLEGAKKFEEEYGCKVEFTNVFEGSDLFPLVCLSMNTSILTTSYTQNILLIKAVPKTEKFTASAMHF